MVIPHGIPKGAAIAINDLLDNPSKKEAISVNARTAAEHYDIKKYMVRLEKIYDNTLQEFLGHTK